MSGPATPAPAAPRRSPAQPALTHPCARCGAAIPLDRGLCENCNPLGLGDAASSQVHGTVILAVGLAIAGLAIAAHLAVAGIGPFNAKVTAMRAGPAAGSVIATIAITNAGTAPGTATCRLTDPQDRGISHADVIYSPEVAAGATVTFDHQSTFGDVARPFDISCSGP